MKVITTKNAEHYTWGESCDGWHFLKSDQLSVIREKVPVGVYEVRHRHMQAQQFFYVLAGTASIEVESECFEVSAGAGLHVPAGARHQLANKGKDVLHFIVVSQPPSHGDRTEVC